MSTPSGHTRAAGTPPRILVTGFEPFLTAPAGPGAAPQLLPNPSAEVAERVARELGLPWAVLPVAFEATWPALAPLLLEVDGWVGVGLAAARGRVEVETLAINVRHNATPDNRGAQIVDSVIDADGPLARRAAWDVAGLVASLTAIHPVAQSHHAGTFLCNEVFYRGLGALRGRAAFVHIPPAEVVTVVESMAVVAAVVEAVRASSR